MAQRRMSPAKKSSFLSSLSVQEKFAKTREEMNRALIEREEEIDLVLTAMISQDNPLLVGPPGTAKSLLSDTIVGWLGGGKAFSHLMTRYTFPEEIFGPFSIRKMKEDQFVRVTTCRLPEAEVAFLDEIFKASSAILNTCLKIFNERIYEKGDGSFVKCPLLICISASNEWPAEQEELGALFDRFLYRRTVKPISDDPESQRRLMFGDTTPCLSTSITAEEIRQAGAEAGQIEFKEAEIDLCFAILKKRKEE